MHDALRKPSQQNPKNKLTGHRIFVKHIETVLRLPGLQIEGVDTHKNVLQKQHNIYGLFKLKPQEQVPIKAEQC